jgi:LAGLIDADG-like domain
MDIIENSVGEFPLMRVLLEEMVSHFSGFVVKSLVEELNLDPKKALNLIQQVVNNEFGVNVKVLFNPHTQVPDEPCYLEQLIFLRNGLIKMSEIEVGQEVLTSDGSYHRIINKIDRGLQKFIKIKTEDGIFLCASNHRVAVLTGCETYEWKFPTDLQCGDMLITPRIAIDGENTTLPPKSDRLERACSKNIVVPNLDEDMAWFLGAFAGDGCASIVGKGLTVTFGPEEYNMAEDTKKQMEKFGDLNVKIIKRSNKEYYDVICYCIRLVKYFNENIKQPHTEIRIPECIMRGTKELKLAYATGVMDADGTIITRPIRLVTTVYEKFARELQIMLYSCGIETRMKYEKCERYKSGGRYDIYLITSCSRQKISEVMQLHKKFSVLRSKNANGFPSSFIKKNGGMGVWSRYYLFRKKHMNIDSYCKEFGAINFCPCEVKSVFECGEYPSFNMEVEEKNEFYCDGFLCQCV